MAPKRPAPLEYPPSTSSSDEEYDEEVEEDEAALGEEADGKEEEEEVDEEEEGDDEEEEDKEAGEAAPEVQVPVSQRDSSDFYDSVDRTAVMNLKNSKTVEDGKMKKASSKAVVQKPVVDTDDGPVKSKTSKHVDGEKVEKGMENNKQVKKRKQSESDLTEQLKMRKESESDLTEQVKKRKNAKKEKMAEVVKKDMPNSEVDNAGKRATKEKVDDVVKDMSNSEPVNAESVDASISHFMGMLKRQLISANGLDVDWIGKGLSLVRKTRILDMVKEWNNLTVDEARLNLRRLELVQEQGQLDFDALKTSSLRTRVDASKE